MQTFCIWETGYKISKIDCIKLRCKNSASGKLDTKYLKLTASSHSLSQNCRDTFVSSLPPMLVYTIWWLNRNKQHWEGKGKHKKSVPTAAVFLSGTVGLSLEWPWQVKKKERKKEKTKETRFWKFYIHKKARVVTKICRVNTTSRGNQTARDFFWFYFSSIFLWKYPMEIPGPAS